MLTETVIGDRNRNRHSIIIDDVIDYVDSILTSAVLINFNDCFIYVDRNRNR